MPETSAPATLVDHYAWMARYNQWMNRRLYDAAARLDDAERKRDRGAFFGSIHGTLNHLCVADKIWLRRFADSGMDFPMLTEEVLALPAFTGLDMVLFADFEAMRRHREVMDRAIVAFAQALTPAQASGTFRYANTRGVERSHPFWQALSHFFNHQTHHRGQVTTLLVQAGIDPGVTDLIVLADGAQG
ncbi:damage-inducible protein DinB [Caldimonas thermodepolymerans]|jgi:uncharacterized damage-inducible protein DinB|uniref:Damage-inducible protein DinB n=1 Tax=Caldimonas thermodepolymerans TaxID=215580 RepID=A0A2S5T9S6_9BURK|nr:DinB family protein [Caldimonas thermodepolymerans]PPE71617.1 damage-inducible protein DinB [Caldimonas thermodepolymerans]QPC30641.1 damage-inducible protein DinB [Caldimonas thermodepolymerans]RDI02752.1 putative damage-inducible protein DinB [Caldimonas thermodepolymerans]TCP08718.1 putative damage-inducible protein DinB [Caldimonas thermodepolymerans]UZG43378.1 DinB family protein [Caldimonas thermodepolymerans]